ncbi:MAG TPA: ABC transporter substrate-binding protein [Burkholderiales bacterium]|nr:ABC transporter substrate-binding protein [Burkholderiales bacterium]
MNRRDTLLGLLALGAAPRSPSAQSAGRVYRIGYLHPGAVGPRDRETLRVGMRELGYVEGETITFVTRLAYGHAERLPALAAELISQHADVIVAVSPSAIRAARKATSSIPIVMGYWGGTPDPAQAGVVASLAHPGGNVTGVNMMDIALEPKRLALLVEAVPGSKLIAVLSYDGSRFEENMAGVRDTARALGVQLRMVEAPHLDDGFARAARSIVQSGAAAVLVPSSPRSKETRRRIIDSMAKYRIPAMFQWDFYADEGGLMAYGPTQREMDRQVARYVDRIFKGGRAGDLPVEQPTKFELVINLKTAKALGLTIPQSVLLRANRVIE